MLPFSLEKQSSHLVASEQVSMICFFFKKKEIRKIKKSERFRSIDLMSAKHTLTEDGPDSAESGNETALYER